MRLLRAQGRAGGGAVDPYRRAEFNRQRAGHHCEPRLGHRGHGVLGQRNVRMDIDDVDDRSLPARERWRQRGKAAAKGR